MQVKYDLIAETLTDRRIPTLTVQKASPNALMPRVLVLHGLHGRKEEYLEELFLLAMRGFRATAIDLALHGQRDDAGDGAQKLATDFFNAMHSVVYKTAADITALLNYWDDSELGFGICAISAGGLVAHAATVADQRITVLVAMITSPDWTTADPKVALSPGSPAYKMLAAISPVNQPERYAPTALLMMVGADDDTVSPSGAILLAKRLVPIYEKLGISDRLRLEVYPEIGHSYTPAMRDLSMEWMEKFLAPKK
jgi:alpha-beta hydrolase superfamily lysophospholipase